MNSAWLITPCSISLARMIPAATPKWAAVASEPRPSASAPVSAVRPPQEIVTVPPSGDSGVCCICQKSYS